MVRLEKLNIWNESMTLVEQIYDITKNFPSEEKFGIVSQMRRCAVSIPSNIAEGAGRNGKGEFRHFLSIANGSTYELQTQIELSKRLGLIPNQIAPELLDKVDKIQKMNFNLQKRINQTVIA
jgi:four helix bundle protein